MSFDILVVVEQAQGGVGDDQRVVDAQFVEIVESEGRDVGDVERDGGVGLGGGGADAVGLPTRSRVSGSLSGSRAFPSSPTAA